MIQITRCTRRSIDWKFTLAELSLILEKLTHLYETKEDIYLEVLFDMRIMSKKGERIVKLCCKYSKDESNLIQEGDMIVMNIDIDCLESATYNMEIYLKTNNAYPAELFYVKVKRRENVMICCFLEEEVGADKQN